MEPNDLDKAEAIMRSNNDEQYEKNLKEVMDGKKAETSHLDKVPVYLSIFEWHVLLGELEHSMRFVNRDTNNPTALYNKISTQLNNGKSIQIDKEKSWIKKRTL